MIKISDVEIVGLRPAIRGMRNPRNSWDKSDSVVCKGTEGFEDCPASDKCQRNKDFSIDVFCVGENDLALMKSLAHAGTDHRKFMRMIAVYADITAPLYWWKEFDTYKVGTVRNSCSTMNSIMDKEFTLDDFSCEYLPEGTAPRITNGILTELIERFNINREVFLDPQTPRGLKELCWREIIQLLPSSYNQKSTVMMNYEVLANIYRARKNHKLDEWREFCKWIETLPYAKELICF